MSLQGSYNAMSIVTEGLWGYSWEIMDYLTFGTAWWNRIIRSFSLDVSGVCPFIDDESGVADIFFNYSYVADKLLDDGKIADFIDMVSMVCPLVFGDLIFRK